jgi:glutamate racemase
LNDAPIGVFDSGVGGLTVLKALAAELPGEHYIYLGDTARLPYGTKSAETVSRYSVQAAEAFRKFDIKALVVACNTASAVGLPAIRETMGEIPVIGVIEPGADAACRVSKSGHIGVIGTEGTVRGGAYQEAIHRIRPDARVNARSTQLFVALAEEGMNEGTIAIAVARHYLDALFEGPPHARTGPDTLVLGCTHFPMLARFVRRSDRQCVWLIPRLPRPTRSPASSVWPSARAQAAAPACASWQPTALSASRASEAGSSASRSPRATSNSSICRPISRQEARRAG